MIIEKIEERLQMSHVIEKCYMPGQAITYWFRSHYRGVRPLDNLELEGGGSFERSWAAVSVVLRLVG